MLVLFGASGDLTKRKLVPALFNLAKAKLLPKNFAVVGVSFDDLTQEKFRDQVTGFLPAEDRGTEAWEWFTQRLYLSARRLCRSQLHTLPWQPSSRTWTGFTAQKPITSFTSRLRPSSSRRLFSSWARQVFRTRRTGTGGAWSSKSLSGSDLDSAKALNRNVKAVLAENQIYRIDHYLGKETVQNIMVFRFDNAIFEPIWNRRYIDHVQITNAETVGVEQRGGYFDNAGTLRDMVPNHIMQLLSLTAMEPPVSFQADAVRNEQAKDSAGGSAA